MFKLPNLSQPKQKVNLLIVAMFIMLQLPFALLAFQTPANAATGDPSSPVSNGGTTPKIYEAGEDYPGGNVTCAQLGYNSTSTRNDYSAGNNSFSDDWPTGISVSVTDDIYVSWTSTFGIGAVIVKGGPNANVYEYSSASTSDSGLASPNNAHPTDPAQDQPYTLSNLTFCYNTNTARTGSVTIVKNVEDGTDPQDFIFTADGTGVNGFTLDDDGTENNPHDDRITFSSNLSAGQYSFTEAAVAGWSVSVSCTGATGVPSNNGRTVTFTLATTNVVCTFVNEKAVARTGSITIIKDAQPNHLQDFIFSATGLDVVPTFTLDDDGENTVVKNSVKHDNLVAGEYSFTEQATTGWTLQSITCSTTEGVTIVKPKVTINLAEGADVSCTFVNTQDEEEIIQENGRVLGESTTVTRGQVLGASTQVVAPVGGVSAGGAAAPVTGSLFGLGSSLTALGYGVASLRKRQ